MKRSEKNLSRIDKKIKNKKIIFLNIVIATCIVVLLGVVINKYIKKSQDKNQEQQEMQLKEEINTIAKVEVNNDYINIKALKEKNTDTVGWIRIEGTQVDYPIVKAQDNEYYLDKAFDNSTNKSGSIFMDFRNVGDFTDVNTILYGHNMAGDTMFGSLRFFREQEYRDKNSIIKIYTEDKIYEYKIFSVYPTEADYDYRTKQFINDNDIQGFLDRITKPSIIKSDIMPKVGDKILTLSTCAFDFEDARLAVHAMQVGEKENK